MNEMEMYEHWWREVIERSIKLLVKWQSIGFVHGVLNTDNLSILGLTIDYGPFGFMEYFDDDFVANYSDHNKRYSYKQQKDAILWNLEQLAIALDDAQILSYDITKKWIQTVEFDKLYNTHFKKSMIAKFGLISADSDIDEVTSLFFDTLQETACDFTNAFRALSMISIRGDSESDDKALIEYLVSQSASPLQYELLKNDHKSPQMILLQRGLPNLRKMADTLRENEQMDSLQGLTLKDIEGVFAYFDDQKVDGMSVEDKREKDTNAWSRFVQSYRNVVNKQYEGNDEAALLRMNQERRDKMDGVNPKYILRNYMLQKAIDEAECGNYEEIESLLQLIQNPFSAQEHADKNGYDRPAPDWAIVDCVSCSS